MLVSKVKQFLSNETGATAIEYAIIAAGISVAVLGAVNALGDENNNVFIYIANSVSAAFGS